MHFMHVPRPCRALAAATLALSAGGYLVFRRVGGCDRPTAFFAAYQKARCQAKLGKKQDAIATAKKGIELAKQANNSDFVTLNEKLIASLQ